MNIKHDAYYAIVKFDGKKIVEYFNSRVYLGQFVKSAYNQIANKDEYQICQIKSKALVVLDNEQQ